MKINVTVDLEDFYNEDDSSFNEQILDSIHYQVKNEIWSEFKKIALDEFKLKINRELEKGKEEETDRIISKIFSEKKIKIREASKGNPEPETITLFEYIEEKISKDYFSPDKTADNVLNRKLHDKQIIFEKMISDSADKIGNQLKERYDLLFASQIVAKLNQQGMLKDDIAKILLENK